MEIPTGCSGQGRRSVRPGQHQWGLDGRQWGWKYEMMGNELLKTEKCKNETLTNELLTYGNMKNGIMTYGEMEK